MLYLEDYLELIEHLPQELRDRLTYVRESDLRVNNSSLQLDARVSQFFAQAKDLTPEQRQCEFENILSLYQKTTKYADDKVDITAQTHDIMLKLVDRLDGELEKFKLELEADNAGITAELERRSLELDSDTRLDGIINNLTQIDNFTQLASGSYPQLHHAYHDRNRHKLNASGIKDRRKSEHKHHKRYHPCHQDNGYHKRAKFSQNEYATHAAGSSSQHNPSINLHHYNHPSIQSHHSSTASSPAPSGANLLSISSAPASVAGDMNSLDVNGGHYINNLNSFSNNSSFMKNSYKNLSFNHHSALSAALSSATAVAPQQLNSISALAMMNASNSSQNNKISISTASGIKGSPDLINANNHLVRQNPLAAAASQAIAATQQLQQGRRTPSLKASFAAVNAASLGNQLDAMSSNRNALAPVAPDHQAYRYNSYSKLSSNGNPLYISVTKSGRPSKRPKHHTSHLYPDESPTSISSDNSVFENSESISSSEFMETGAAFDSTSPTSLDFNNSRTAEQSGTDQSIYQRDETKYCICRQISYGEMVACDNEECEIEWFHYNCVGVTQPPRGKWYCPDCTRKMDNHPTQQTQKKRGRKEKSVFNLVNNSLETSNDRTVDRTSSGQESKASLVST